MNLFPTINTRIIETDSNTVLSLESWVRIKIRKKWYERLITDKCILDINNESESIIRSLNQFNEKCFALYHCHIDLSEKFIKENPDIIKESKLQISEKNRITLRYLFDNNLLRASI